MSTDNLAVALSGAIPGAMALAVIGFGWSGWVTSGTAEAMSKARSEAAVIAALAPICLDQYQRSPVATTKTTKQAVLDDTRTGVVTSRVESGGWAKMPGSPTARSGVAQACAKLILDQN